MHFSRGLLRTECAIQFRLAKVEASALTDDGKAALIDEPVDRSARKSCVAGGTISAHHEIGLHFVSFNMTAELPSYLSGGRFFACQEMTAWLTSFL